MGSTMTEHYGSATGSTGGEHFGFQEAVRGSTKSHRGYGTNGSAARIALGALPKKHYGEHNRMGSPSGAL